MPGSESPQFNDEAKAGAGRLARRRTVKWAAAIMLPILLFLWMAGNATTSAMGTVMAAGALADDDEQSTECAKSDDGSDADAQGIVAKYVEKAKEIAADDSHGYDQGSRNLNPDTDCSGFVFYSLKKAGIKNIGETPFNTSGMDTLLPKAGFKKVAWGGDEKDLQKGDILWWDSGGNRGHTEIYIGDHQNVGAHYNENGGITGGKPGDQTQHEVSIEKFSPGTSTHYFRLEDTSAYDGSAATAGDKKTGSADVSRNAHEIASKLAGEGFSRAATAGILGNLAHESGMDPAREQIPGNPNGGFGLMQWTPRSKVRTWLDRHNLNGTPDTDLNGQIRMLADAARSDWNNVALDKVKGEGTVPSDTTDLKKLFDSTGDPQIAASAFMAGCERPSWGSRNEDARRNAAKQYYDSLTDISFTGRQSSSSDESDSQDGQTDECSVDDSDGGEGEGSAQYGSVGGAPTDTHSFAWMCSGNQKICTASDAGVFYPHLEYGHQCVWYAWNRLAMIHGNEGWTWVVGDGGDIWANVQGKPGWEVSDTPKPGDGASGKTQPFAGSTHVAVIEEVRDDPSGWKVRISEGNFDGSATFDSYNSRWLTKTQMAGIHFFRNTNWKK